MSGLTDAQRKILAFIQGFIGERGFPPTRREIAEHFEFESFSGADGHLVALERKGYISITRGVSRGIRVLKAAIV